MTNLLFCSGHPDFYTRIIKSLNDNATIDSADSMHKCLCALSLNLYDFIIYEYDQAHFTHDNLLKLLKKRPSQRVVGVYSHTDCDEIKNHLSSGLSGIVAKEEFEAIYKDLIEILYFGGVYISKKLHNAAKQSSVTSFTPSFPVTATLSNTSNSLNNDTHKQLRRNENKNLTPRQHEIFVHVTEGMSNREIAIALDIAEGTVKAHLNTIYKKLEISNRFQIFRYLEPSSETSQAMQKQKQDALCYL